MQQSKETLIISALDFVHNIEDAVGNYLPLPPRGIYIKGQVKPAILEGEPYYSSSSIRTNTPVDVMLCTEDLYNQEGKLVVPSFIMQNKERFCTSLPRHNPVIFDILEDFILGYFEQVCPYNHSKTHQERMITHMFNGDKTCENLLVYYLDSLTLRLASFINGEHWRHYTLARNNYDFVVTKGDDFRILDWMRTHPAK